MDMACWNLEEQCLQAHGASGRAKDPARLQLSLEEQQHCGTFPGSLAPHLVKRRKAGGRRGVRKEREGGEGRARALADAHTPSRQRLAEDGTACLALVIAAGWLLPMEHSPASAAGWGHGGENGQGRG